MNTASPSLHRNLVFLYIFQATSRLWFDGALWVVYWQHRGLTLFEVGLLEALLHLVSLTLDIPMGIFADRIGWKVSLMLSGVAGAIYCFCSLLPHPFVAGMLAFAFRGLQITMSNGSDMAMTYETVKASGNVHRYQIISGRMMATQLISLGMAEALGGYFASQSWVLVYGAFGVANLLSSVCTLFLKTPVTKNQGHGATTGDSVTESDRPSFLQIVQDAYQFAKFSSSYRRWIAYSATLSGIIATCAFYGQSLLHGSGWSTGEIGLLTGLECGMSALASVASQPITCRFGARTLAGLAVFGMLLFSWLPGAGKGIGYLFSQASGSAAEPLIDRNLNDLVPSSSRATLLSANSTAFSLFMVIGFPLFGALIGSVGIQSAYHWGSILLATCAAVAGIALGLTSRKQTTFEQTTASFSHHPED
ncbi:MFS transporter [Alicyclobacillus dauci]|nr:MFS transporter [Alicyclobacillus dauci]